MMEVDQSTSAWLLSRALNAKNINEARVWLESAKLESPKSFNMMISAYELECRALTSPKDTANVILGLVKNEEFINEPRLWDEVRILLESDTDSNRTAVNIFRSEVITALGPTNFRELIIEFINIYKQEIELHIELLLKILKKYPDYIKPVGPNVCDKLFMGEKHDAGEDPDLTPLNRKRHLAVNTVFPVLFESGKLDAVQAKTLYKWFQKSLEYTVWYVSTTKRPSDLPMIEGDAWEKLRKIRLHIGKHAGWEAEPSLPCQPAQALWQMVKWLKSIYLPFNYNSRRPPPNLNAIRKQTFYTAVSVYLEAAVRYMAISEPALIRNPSGKKTYSQFPIYGMIIDAADKPKGKYFDKNFEDMCERQQFFTASIAAKKILTDDDIFAEDLQKLQRALKFNKWHWLEAFHIDCSFKDGDFDHAIFRLSHLIKAENWQSPLLYRWRVQLGSCYYELKKIRTSVTYLYDAMMQEQEDTFDTEIDGEYILSNQMGEIEWVRGVHCDVLIIAIHAILNATAVLLDRASAANAPHPRQMQIVGWMLVLSQYEWPRFFETTKYAIEKIKSEGSFTYPNMLDFIYEGGVIEELAWLLNQDVPLNISNANEPRELREQLIKAVRSTISPSICIRNFLIITKEEILSEMELPNR